MRLQTLEIDKFKSLNNFQIAFGTGSNTVLLGQNGTGKSHLLEALVIIFRDLELGARPTFKYKIKYSCYENTIYIDADPERDRDEEIRIAYESLTGVSTTISYQAFYTSRKDLDNQYLSYLPRHVFTYYSGISSRMTALFTEYQDGIYREVVRGTEKLSHSLFHAYHAYGPLALLAFFVEEDKTIQEFLEKEFGINNLISALFVVNEPLWHSKEDDSRFWNAPGIVKQWLIYMSEIAFAPMGRKARVRSDFNTKVVEQFCFYIRNVHDLKILVACYGSPQNFFKALESIYISKMLSSVRIRFQKDNVDKPLTFQDLSEGEQQLLTVLGLLRFTKEDEALFLLDEPDTHLNPKWSVQYLDLIHRIVGNHPSSQVIMTTHNPLVIASLEREDVRIMQRDQQSGRIYADMPEENPQGMGVSAILTSDLFGLRTTLDKPTQNKLDRRRELAFSDKDLNVKEQEELNVLNYTLSNLDFSITARDPLYQSFASEYREFIKEFTRRAAPDLKGGIVFTPEQRQRQRELTRRILGELKAQRGQ